jgi:hypothetical protein
VVGAAKISSARIFRAIRKNGKVWATGLDESAIWQIVRHYAAQVGHENFAPHDARRSCARIYYDAKAPLKQIQFLLGHDKLDTTARYVNDEQKFGGGSSQQSSRHQLAGESDPVGETAFLRVAIRNPCILWS